MGFSKYGTPVGKAVTGRFSAREGGVVGDVDTELGHVAGDGPEEDRAGVGEGDEEALPEARDTDDVDKD